jgi:hypothetical protein
LGAAGAFDTALAAQALARGEYGGLVLGVAHGDNGHGASVLLRRLEGASCAS